MKIKIYQVALYFKLLGILFIIINFLPLEFIFGDIKGFKWSLSPYMWLLSIGISCSISWLLNALFPDLIEKLINISTKLIIRILDIIVHYQFIIFPACLLTISTYAFSRRPLLIDSIVQLFQAEIFATGSLKASPPKYPEFFVTQHMILDTDGWYGQYPPGHSIMLLIGVLLKAPWVVAAVLTTLTSYLIFLFTKNIFGTDVSKLTLALLLISPFFMFMGASHMNHVSILFWVSIWLYSFERFESTNSKKYLFISSFAAGFGILVRPLDTIATAIFLIPTYIQIAIKTPKNLLIILLGALPPIFSGLWYNLKTTGDAFLPGYIKLWGKSHGLGFHESPWGKEHTPITGLRNELVDIQLLNEMLFEWPIPSLAFVSLLLIFSNFSNPWAKRLLGIGLSYPLLYFFYWHRDAFLGPRFMYSAIIAWIPLTGFAILETLKISNTITIRPFNLFNPFKVSNFLKTLLGFSILFSLIINIPQRYKSYQTSYASIKLNIIDKAKNSGINTGLIFVKSSWGVRIMSQLRGLGVNASLTQIAYSNLDHCLLDEMIKQAYLENWDQLSLSSKIVQNLDLDKKAFTVKVNFDPSLKLDPRKPITDQCKDELRYDLKNGEQFYTVYEPHMRSNQPQFNGEYVVAKDLRGRNKLLVQEFPWLKAYLFDGKNFKVLD